MTKYEMMKNHNERMKELNELKMTIENIVKEELEPIEEISHSTSTAERQSILMEEIDRQSRELDDILDSLANF